MARSYTRLKRRSSKGLRVREDPVTNAVNVNSLYCLPVKKTVAAASVGETVILEKYSTHGMRAGSSDSDKAIEDGVVRCASIKMSSKSPFRCYVRNASQGWTCFECPGQKVVKLALNRESHVAGNPALFIAQQTNSAANKALIKIDDAEDQVDITFNIVVDSTLD